MLRSYILWPMVNHGPKVVSGKFQKQFIVSNNCFCNQLLQSFYFIRSYCWARVVPNVQIKLVLSSWGKHGIKFRLLSVLGIHWGFQAPHTRIKDKTAFENRKALSCGDGLYVAVGNTRVPFLSLTRAHPGLQGSRKQRQRQREKPLPALTDTLF